MELDSTNVLLDIQSSFTRERPLGVLSSVLAQNLTRIHFACLNDGLDSDLRTLLWAVNLIREQGDDFEFVDYAKQTGSPLNPDNFVQAKCNSFAGYDLVLDLIVSILRKQTLRGNRRETDELIRVVVEYEGNPAWIVFYLVRIFPDEIIASLFHYMAKLYRETGNDVLQSALKSSTHGDRIADPHDRRSIFHKACLLYCETVCPSNLCRSVARLSGSYENAVLSYAEDISDRCSLSFIITLLLLCPRTLVTYRELQLASFDFRRLFRLLDAESTAPFSIFFLNNGTSTTIKATSAIWVGLLLHSLHIHNSPLFWGIVCLLVDSRNPGDDQDYSEMGGTIGMTEILSWNRARPLLAHIVAHCQRLVIQGTPVFQSTDPTVSRHVIEHLASVSVHTTSSPEKQIACFSIMQSLSINRGKQVLVAILRSLSALTDHTRIPQTVEKVADLLAGLDLSNQSAFIAVMDALTDPPAHPIPLSPALAPLMSTLLPTAPSLPPSSLHVRPHRYLLTLRFIKQAVLDSPRAGLEIASPLLRWWVREQPCWRTRVVCAAVLVACGAASGDAGVVDACVRVVVDVVGDCGGGGEAGWVVGRMLLDIMEEHGRKEVSMGRRIYVRIIQRLLVLDLVREQFVQEKFLESLTRQPPLTVEIIQTQTIQYIASTPRAIYLNLKFKSIPLLWNLLKASCADSQIDFPTHPMWELAMCNLASLIRFWAQSSPRNEPAQIQVREAECRATTNLLEILGIKTSFGSAETLQHLYTYVKPGDLSRILELVWVVKIQMAMSGGNGEGVGAAVERLVGVVRRFAKLTPSYALFL
ncbi:hypothetical protein BJ742DRAFT_797462 [Cladochytrium replicatum]|nr:hypothetical protein BJ742DRAFT_797462 [Cladochytrium replicatum]